MITITDKAKEKIENLMQDSEMGADYFLRVSVTVTPDTEKDVVPTHKEEQVSKGEELRPSEEKAETEAEPAVGEGESGIAEDADVEKSPANAEPSKGNDPGDEIETVSA